MARAYSDDVRRKVWSAYVSGKGTMRELAVRFDVSYGFVKNLAAATRKSGRPERTPQRPRRSLVDHELIRRLVEAEPDIVLVELQRKAAAEDVRVSIVHLWRILAKLGLRLKKSRSTPSSGTAKKTSASADSTSGRLSRSHPKT